MKHFFTILGIAIAMTACTPESLEPETIPVQAVELSSSTLTLHPGDKVSLTATVIPTNATEKNLVWFSSDETVATVSQVGEVSAVSVGTAVVTASCGGRKAECEVTVSLEHVPVTSISLDQSDVSLFVGDTFQLTATVIPDLSLIHI